MLIDVWYEENPISSFKSMKNILPFVMALMPAQKKPKGIHSTGVAFFYPLHAAPCSVIFLALRALLR